MKVYKAFLTFIIVTVVFTGTPFVVHAQSANELRAQIAQVLAQIYSLRAQLQTGSATPTNVTPVRPSYTGNSIAPSVTSSNGLATFQYSRCPDLQFNLERGDSDTRKAVEVTMAQRFFAQDSRLYPEGLVTGYFGPSTERAVQRFQERHGIVTYGDYKATGYGRIGPRTRHAIANSCGIAGTHSFNVSPVAGAAPLQVSATFEFKGSSCTSYQLDWGDGTTPVSRQAVSSANCSEDSVRKQATHTYTNAGAYVVTLRVGRNSVYSIPIVGKANVLVQGTAGAASKASLVVSTTRGNAPLFVTATLRSSTPSSCTSHSLDWGDATQSVWQEAGGYGCTNIDSFSQRFTHTYQNPGIYVLNARAGRGRLSNLTNISQQITVQSGTVVVSTTCFISPNNGRAPLATQARILFGGTLCDGTLTYNVDWGDGTSSATRTCSDPNAHYEQFSHTYTNNGTYIARLNQSHPNARFEEQICTVNVTDSSTPTGTGGVTTTNRDSLSYRIINSSLRTVEFTALINTARNCNGGTYTIYFGDSTDSLQPYPADACQLFTRTVSHTYSRNGTYTALLLKNGVTVDQVTITVSGSSSSTQKNIAAAVTAVEDFIKALFK